MDYKAMYHELLYAATAQKQHEAEREAAQELAGRQMREKVNLNAEHKYRQKTAAEAARRRKRAIRKAAERAAAKRLRCVLTSFMLLGIASVWVLGYLVGIGEGKQVAISLAFSAGVVLITAGALKLISAIKRKRGAGR